MKSEDVKALVEAGFEDADVAVKGRRPLWSRDIDASKA